MSLTAFPQTARADSEESSILAAFRRAATRAPDRVLFTFVDEKGRDEDSVTPRELHFAGEGIARLLRTWGVAAGDRAVLVYPPSMDFIRALLGCLIAGVVPVPAYPPDPIKRNQDRAGLAGIVADSGARVVLTNGAYDRARTLGALKDRLGGSVGVQGRQQPTDVAWRRTDVRTPTPIEPLTWHVPTGPDEPALLQYTSGSTAAPKGVIITHGNLAHEVAANARDLGLGEGARGVFWVPQYHDLGLISVILSTLSGNSTTYLMSPLTFLQRPAVWFDVMSRVRATHTAAPNFAFDLAVRKTKPAMLERWDLSSVRVVMSAAEPIRAATVRRFFDTFAACGLRRESFYPAYGLAEHTVSVTMGGKTTLALDKAALDAGLAVPVAAGTPAAEGATVEIVGCGRVKAGARVRVVDPETALPAPPGAVGEVWVDSPTKAAGYFGRPAETRLVFEAAIADGTDTTRYLRTGDLGFFHGEELFITGRAKDLIIFRGRNIYPQDLEDTCRDAHPLIRPGGLAAFTVAAADGSDEQLVMFVETRVRKLGQADVAEIVHAVRRSVMQSHQLACHTVVIGQAGLVRKTTSGKVRRRACKQAFLDGEVAAAAATTIAVSRLNHMGSANQ